MAPEQILGKPINHQTDIYSLGMTLYVMLAGWTPFNEEETSEFAFMKACLEDTIPDPREYYPYIPEPVVKVVFSALERDLKKRLLDCASFKVSLKSVDELKEIDRLTNQVEMEAAEEERREQEEYEKQMEHSKKQYEEEEKRRQEKVRQLEENQRKKEIESQQESEKRVKTFLFIIAIIGVFFIIMVIHNYNGNLSSDINSREIINEDNDKSIELETDSSSRGPIAGMTFVQIPAGSYIMGALPIETGLKRDSYPRHKVTVSAFELMSTEVTVSQFGEFVDATGYDTDAEKNSGSYAWNGTEWAIDSEVNWNHPGFLQSDQYPVVCVSWNDVIAFIDWLNIRDPQMHYRLPTEAEWEYACRTGNAESIFWWGNDAAGNDLSYYEWYYDNSNSIGTHAVSIKPSNPWGLYDMHGNVGEWVHDWYDVDYYSKGNEIDPSGPLNGLYRVVRGGNWTSTREACSPSVRYASYPSFSAVLWGFRVARVSIESKTADLTSKHEDKTERNLPEEIRVPSKIRMPKLGITFIQIPEGNFTMGALANEKDSKYDEYPRHQVHVSSFEIMSTEVTQETWATLMRNNPSHFKGNRLPVEKVSWYDVQEFIQELNKYDPSYTYRLPTEAEWEYACRAGEDGSRFSWGDDLDYSRLPAYAWYNSNSQGTTHAIASKLPNKWGLYDMHGNVQEWCQDYYSDQYYKSSPVSNPRGSISGKYRSTRGGYWAFMASSCRSASRRFEDPSEKKFYLGFRLVRVPMNR